MIQAYTKLLTKIHGSPNYISPSAYDTGWAAWLYPQALEWVIDAQRPDGSWGVSELEYYHGRVIATLSAINALAATSSNGHDLQRIERGIAYLEKAIPHLADDAFESVSFELLLPSLLETGISLGLKLNRLKALIEPQIMPLYQQKLALTPKELLYCPHIPLAHALEFIGFEKLDRTAVSQLRAAYGGIHSSPAATAFVEIAVGCQEGDCFLKTLLERYNGAVPAMLPFEVFEVIWPLYHFSLSHNLQSLKPAIDSPVDLLKQAWGEEGVGISSHFIPDADCTALALLIFDAVGETIDPLVLETYEVETHFQCYLRERNISLGTHIHLVDALNKVKNFPRREEMLAKALNVLACHLTTTDYIIDKWHISPYYSTARAVQTLVGVADEIVARQLNWLLKTQREDGSWTFYPHCPKAAIEETAYALTALTQVYEKTGDIPFAVLERGYRYLTSHYTSVEALPGMWIAKELYNPYHVVESVILLAMAKYQNLTRKPRLKMVF
ncbi:MAG: hypothetical protein JW953_00880 [Anaerolineae bacterium]|nr:hypothetical protein [Anaerolineae bacterium]